MLRRRFLLAAALLTTLVIAAVVAVRHIEEPLRRHMEQQLNASLTGYRVHIGGLRLHLVGGSLDLLDSTIAQTANPEPPVARVPRLHASVHWRALLHGALAGDFWLDRPVLNIDVRQAGAEVRGKVPIRQRGWQEAVDHIYPLKIDLFRVTDGDVTYTPARPLPRCIFACSTSTPTTSEMSGRATGRIRPTCTSTPSCSTRQSSEWTATPTSSPSRTPA